MMPADNALPTAARAARVQKNIQTAVESGLRSVNVHLFAGAAAAVGARHVRIQFSNSATIAELSESLGAAYPQLQSLLPHSRWAIGDQFVSSEERIAADEQRPIAMIPPVSGG